VYLALGAWLLPFRTLVKITTSPSAEAGGGPFGAPRPEGPRGKGLAGSGNRVLTVGSRRVANLRVLPLQAAKVYI
jgi:hypothetical protein